MEYVFFLHEELIYRFVSQRIYILITIANLLAFRLEKEVPASISGLQYCKPAQTQEKDLPK